MFGFYTAISCEGALVPLEIQHRSLNKLRSNVSVFETGRLLWFASRAYKRGLQEVHRTRGR